MHKQRYSMKKSRTMIFIVLSALTLLTPVIFGKLDAHFSTDGVEEAKAFPSVTVKTILNGEAQAGFEDYVQQNLPGKPLMVRLRNQITFSLLRTTPNNNYSMNQDLNLFTWGNVSSYMQYNEPVSDEYTRGLVEKIERLEKLASDNGIQLFVFVTPCKVRYCEEELPWVDQVMAPEKTEGNYEKLIRDLESSGLKYFDSIDYINSHKEEFDSRVPLFYRTSVHWSVYVGNLVGAAFGDYIEAESGYDLPELSITARPCEEPVYPDSDAFNTFNLLQKSYDQYYEPVIEVTDAATDAPGMLCRGGSFMGQSLSAIIRNHYFGKNVYMENDQIFTEEFGEKEIFHDYNDVDMKEYLKDIDILILEVNEPSIPSMSFGFIDYVLEHPEVLSQEE